MSVVGCMNASELRKEVYALTIFTLTGALTDTLVALGESRGTKDMSWFDELEAKFIRDLKNRIAEGVSLDDDAEIFEGALTLLRFALSQARDATLNGQRDL